MSTAGPAGLLAGRTHRPLARRPRSIWRAALERCDQAFSNTVPLVGTRSAMGGRCLTNRETVRLPSARSGWNAQELVNQVGPSPGRSLPGPASFRGPFLKPAPVSADQSARSLCVFFGLSPGPEGPTGAQCAREMGPDDAALPQFVKVRQTYAGERIEDVGLSRADTAGRGGLGSCAKDAASGHGAHRTSAHRCHLTVPPRRSPCGFLVRDGVHRSAAQGR